MIGTIVLGGMYLFLVDTTARTTPHRIETESPPHDERPTALHIRALATLSTPMKGQSLVEIKAEMTAYVAIVAEYHQAMCTALQRVALDDTGAAERNDAVWNARIGLVTTMPGLQACGVAAFDAALCLPPIGLECGMKD